MITLEQAVAVFGTRYKVAKALGLKPATVYGSWGKVVPRKHWERLAELSGGELDADAPAEDQAA